MRKLWKWCFPTFAEKSPENCLLSPTLHIRANSQNHHRHHHHFSQLYRHHQLLVKLTISTKLNQVSPSVEAQPGVICGQGHPPQRIIIIINGGGSGGGDVIVTVLLLLLTIKYVLQFQDRLDNFQLFWCLNRRVVLICIKLAKRFRTPHNEKRPILLKVFERVAPELTCMFNCPCSCR